MPLPLASNNKWLFAMLLCGASDLDAEEKSKSYRLVSSIVSQYLPSFLMIHLNPKACEGPRLTLFQRDFCLFMK